MDDYIDWSKVPAGYDWVAVDSPGETSARIMMYDSLPNKYGVGAYESRPNSIPESLGGFFSTADGNDILVSQDAIIGPLPPWRESLRERPRKEP